MPLEKVPFFRKWYPWLVAWDVLRSNPEENPKQKPITRQELFEAIKEIEDVLDRIADDGLVQARMNMKFPNKEAGEFKKDLGKIKEYVSRKAKKKESTFKDIPEIRDTFKDQPAGAGLDISNRTLEVFVDHWTAGMTKENRKTFLEDVFCLVSLFLKEVS